MIRYLGYLRTLLDQKDNFHGGYQNGSFISYLDIFCVFILLSTGAFQVPTFTKVQIYKAVRSC